MIRELPVFSIAIVSIFLNYLKHVKNTEIMVLLNKPRRGSSEFTPSSENVNMFLQHLLVCVWIGIQSAIKVRSCRIMSGLSCQLKIAQSGEVNQGADLTYSLHLVRRQSSPPRQFMQPLPENN